jgi:hypothetical protein
MAGAQTKPVFRSLLKKNQITGGVSSLVAVRRLDNCAGLYYEQWAWSKEALLLIGTLWKISKA